MFQDKVAVRAFIPAELRGVRQMRDCRRVQRFNYGRGAGRCLRGLHPSLTKNASIFRQIHLPHGGRLWRGARGRPSSERPRYPADDVHTALPK